MTDEEKPKGDDQETIPKADFDKLKADNERLEKDLEDTRMEVLTPEYQKFLDNLEKGGDKKEDELAPEDKKASDDEFAKKNPDYETFRPIMYGLSLDPKNADLSIAQLYAKSKEHVKRLGGGVDDKEKKRINHSASEKPGGDSHSLEKLKSMSNDDIALEAVAEMKAAGMSFDNI